MPNLTPSKKLYQDLLLLFLAALLIRWLAALPQQQPNYMDAAYYYVNALNLVEGRGFVEDFIWLYLDNPDSPPRPSHLYWMPLTSILAWLGMLIGGPTYRAAQIPFIILSALLVPLTYFIAHLLTRQRRLCWLAGLLAVFSGFYVWTWTAIDTFTPFALAGSLALLAAWPAINKQPLSIHHSQLIPPVLSGISIALAHLSRADGPLLLIAIILTYVLYLISNPIPLLRLIQHTIRVTAFFLLGYLLIMTPWFVRNWQAVGTPFPIAGTQTIWLVDYNELFSYGRELSAQTFFAQGIDQILQGRWWAFTTNLQTVLAVWGMIFLLPLSLGGFWTLRRHRLVQLAGVYALLLFIAMTLVFAFPGARGGLFHSGAALLPFIYATAGLGLDRGIEWLAARRRAWDARLAKRFFSIGLVLLAILLSGFIYYQRVLKNNAWNKADLAYAAVAEWVLDQDPAAIVMINNPPAYRYHGGGLSVVVPHEDVETTLQAARRYRVDYLVLGPNDPTQADVYRQTVNHPHLSLVHAVGGIKIFKIERYLLNNLEQSWLSLSKPTVFGRLRPRSPETLRRYIERG